MCVCVKVWLKKLQNLQKPKFPSTLAFSCMASLQSSFYCFCNLTTVSSPSVHIHFFSISFRTWFPAFCFLSSSMLHAIPEIIPIVCPVPMAHQQKQWEGDSGTIHGTRMVFIFLTAVPSQFSCVFSFVWANSRKKSKRRKKRGQRVGGEKMEQLN